PFNLFSSIQSDEDGFNFDEGLK
ncbi:uncharacterized protein METZ01_LOCUS471394, partial [marine metagenome]